MNGRKARPRVRPAAKDGRSQPNWNWRGHGEISGAYWTCVKHNAELRGLIVSISIKEAWDVFLAQNRKCAYSGDLLTFTRNYQYCKSEQTASLDRINNELGYVSGNIQWVHKAINGMKSGLSDSEFIQLCCKVAQTRGVEPYN
jgi:hypothetical protein